MWVISHHGMGASSRGEWRNGLQYGGWLRIYWISSRGQPTRGGPPALGVGRGANNSSPQKRRLLRNIHIENSNKASHSRRETLWRHGFTDRSWHGFETLWRGSLIDVRNVTHCNADRNLVTLVVLWLSIEILICSYPRFYHTVVPR
jgi:hypothetical protein